MDKKDKIINNIYDGFNDFNYYGINDFVKSCCGEPITYYTYITEKNQFCKKCNKKYSLISKKDYHKKNIKKILKII